MKEGIHPVYYPEAKVICACGNSWTVGSTQEEIRTDVCSACHPFYTGEQRIVDTEGQVDRFYKRLEARQKFVDDIEAREAERVSPERPLSEFELTKRATDALQKANVTTAGDVLDILAQGDKAMLAIEGFGRKSLADLKKRMRRFGYELPGEESESSS